MVRRCLAVAVTLCACGAGVPQPDGGSDAEDAGEPLDAGADAGSADAGSDVGVDGGLDAGPVVLVYPTDRTQSPLTAEVAAHLQAIAALAPSKQGDVFSKIGDSNTVNTNYLACYAGANVDLGGRAALDPALQHFRLGMVGGTTPYNRTSLAATIGWSAFGALAGAPSPLQQEVDAAQPRFATVMFGTNDVGFGDPYRYGRDMFTIVDTLAMQGVVPIVSSIPPRDDSATADAWVPRYNLVARGIAQARRVPFVDLHRELLPIPSHGLGPDGVHLNVYFPAAGARGCVLTPAGLAFGNNVRNLVTLEALSRALGAVQGAAPPDATGPLRVGSGLPGDEIAIGSLPFVDVRDTRVDGVARIASYPGCASTANESGREVLYRLELAQPTNLRAFVVSLGSADIDVHLLSSPDSGQACLQRNDKVITAQLAAGTWWLSLDTYQSSAGVLAGEYLLAVLAE